MNTFVRRLGPFLLVSILPLVAATMVVSESVLGWDPVTEDLWVYREAANYLLSGRNFYELENAFPFIYPPIAAVLAIPLVIVPWSVAQFLWTLLNVFVLVAVLRHLGVRTPWVLSFAATVVILFVTPVASTLVMGQLGVILLGLVLLDVLDGPRLFRDDKRLVPAGVLTGLATGLKLTPAVFIVYFFLTKRYRQGFVALGTFAATVLIGLVAAPQVSGGYWLRLAGGDSGANPDAYGWINNLSMMSAVYRFTGVTTMGTLLGLALSGVLVAGGLAAAWVSRRAGRELLGVSILGMVSCIANPIAWVHHLTWVVPLLVAGVRDRLPAVLRWSVLIGALWCILNPQFDLGGAPWAHKEIFEYSVAEKLVAAGPDIVVTLMVVFAVVTLRQAPAPAAQPGIVEVVAAAHEDADDEAEVETNHPKQALTDGEKQA